MSVAAKARIAPRAGDDIFVSVAARDDSQPPVEFPGDHGGFIGQPDAFAEVIVSVLAG